MTHAQCENTTDPKQVCILWHPADRSPAEALIRALSKRGLAVTLASGKHQAFAAACRSEKTAKRVVIVLDDRDSLLGVDRVLDGLERFGPGVICWEHIEGANPPMVPAVRTSASAGVVQSQSDSDPEPERESASSTLRLVGNGGASSEKPKITLTSASPKSGTISSSDVLNADELDALLAGEMGEGRRGK